MWRWNGTNWFQKRNIPLRCGMYPFHRIGGICWNGSLIITAKRSQPIKNDLSRPQGSPCLSNPICGGARKAVGSDGGTVVGGPSRGRLAPCDHHLTTVVSPPPSHHHVMLLLLPVAPSPSLVSVSHVQDGTKHKTKPLHFTVGKRLGVHGGSYTR